MIVVLFLVPLFIFLVGVVPEIIRSQPRDLRSFLFGGLRYEHVVSSTVGTVLMVSSIAAIIGSYIAMGSGGELGAILAAIVLFPLVMWLLVSRKKVKLFYIDSKSKDKMETFTVLSFAANGNKVSAKFLFYLWLIPLVGFIFAEMTLLLVWMRHLFGGFQIVALGVPAMLLGTCLIYVLFGGYRAVLRTDFWQFIIISFLLAFSLYHVVGVLLGGSYFDSPKGPIIPAPDVHDVLFSFADKEVLWPIFHQGIYNPDSNIVYDPNWTEHLNDSYLTSLNPLYALGVVLFIAGWFLSLPDLWFRLTQGFYARTSSKQISKEAAFETDNWFQREWFKLPWRLVRGFRDFGEIGSWERVTKIWVLWFFVAVFVSTVIFLPGFVAAAAKIGCHSVLDTNYEWPRMLVRICESVNDAKAREGTVHTITFLHHSWSNFVGVAFVGLITLFAISSIDTALITLAQLRFDLRGFQSKQHPGKSRALVWRVVLLAFGVPLAAAVAAQALLDQWDTVLIAALAGYGAAATGLLWINMLAVRIALPNCPSAKGWGMVATVFLTFGILGVAIYALQIAQFRLPLIGFMPLFWFNIGQTLVLLILFYWSVVGIFLAGDKLMGQGQKTAPVRPSS